MDKQKDPRVDMQVIASDLNNCKPVQELVAKCARGDTGARNELVKMDVLRSRGGPMGDYAEWLIEQLFGFKRASVSNQESWDARDEYGRRYQIKARPRIPSGLSWDHNTQPDFDYLLAMVLNEATSDLVLLLCVSYEEFCGLCLGKKPLEDCRLTARCSEGEPMATWLHEWLFRRPSREDSRCRRTGGLQEPGGPRLRREPLSSVKRYVKEADHGGSLAPKKSPGSAPKLDEKATKLLEADPKQRPFATLQERRDYIHALTGPSVSRSTTCLPRHSPDRIGQEKGGRSATERDEFRRAAWRRVMVAGAVEPEMLLFVDTSAGCIPRWLRSTATLPQASACVCRCRETGARTRRYFRV